MVKNLKGHLNLTRKIPYITILLTFLSISWFLYVNTKYGTTLDNKVLYQNGAILGQYFTPTEWWRLITPVFVHIGVDHLISNMILLISLGPIIESTIGRTKFLLLYLLSGIGGNLAVLYFNPDVLTAGASTALYGLFGFLLIQTFNRQNAVLRNISSTYITIIVINLVYTFTNTHVSVVGHLGGLIAGAIFGLIELNRN